MIKIIKIDIENKHYPHRLRTIENAPKSIYAVGNIDILNNEGIAVIGSRNNTEYGKKWCKYFTEKLLEYDLSIISGMALGIDSIAHNTCLENKGKTIAVLPSGFDNIYPEENIKLFEEITKKGGVVISEYDPKTKVKSQYCLERNRIVSGLAIATLVIEAQFRSGTSVTAGYTEEQKKMVFCLPSSLDNKKGIGTNNLIKKGAILVTEINDIISKFDFLMQRKPKKITEDKILKKEYLEIYNLIDGEPTSIENIIKKSGIPTNEVMSKITMMELEEYIKMLPGNKVVKINE